MKIAVLGRKLDKPYTDGIALFFRILKDNNCEVHVYKPFYENLLTIQIGNIEKVRCFTNHAEIDSSFDFFFSLGGDGTFLESVKFIRNTGVPIVGINTGRLGFLASISLNEIEKSINYLFSGNFETEGRNLIRFDCPNNPFEDFPYALNEITVQKHDTSLVNIDASINEQVINTYWADGLIISTPTGSTAYSMSTGGPIVAPDCNVFIISPIASHNLTVRPIIVTDKHGVNLSISSRSNSFIATIDSQSHRFQSGTNIHLTLSDFQIKVVRLPNHSFFNTIRKKLMWGADVRN